MSNQYEMERVGASAQRAQSEMMKAIDRTIADLKKMMENLAKSFGNGKDITIEIRVGGKTKLKGQVKDGVFTASKNELTPDEIKSLKRFFASLPNPDLKPKDFEVMVDNKTVLKTENGAVVSHATPERSEEARQAFEAVRSPSVSPIETPAQSAASSVSPVATSAQAQAPQPTATAEAERTLGAKLSPASRPTVERSQSQQPEPAKAERSPTPVATEPALIPTPQPQATASSIPKDKTGLIPPDYGIESAKGISWDALKASGDQALMRSYGSLENVRVDLNDSYERASHPGYEWIAKVPHIAELEQRLAAEIPVFEARLTESIKQGKYPDPRTAGTTQPETKTTPVLDADQNRNNRDLLEKAKCSLALLSDRPSGEREWVGKDYALTEGKDGSFTVTHQSRGEILNFANGKVTGQATTQDVAKLHDLLAVAKQTHVPQQKQPEQKKSLAVGGIKA
jgi:hypothetical protein